MPDNKGPSDNPVTNAEFAEPVSEEDGASEQESLAEMPRLRSGYAPKRNTIIPDQTEHDSVTMEESMSIEDRIRSYVHDSNQLITSILGFAQLAIIRQKKGSDITEILNNIVQGADRQAAITEKLRQNTVSDHPPAISATPVPPKLMKVCLSDIIDAHIAPRQAIHKHIRFIFKLPPNLEVLSDMYDIHRILENLLGNSLRALEKLEEGYERERRITISVIESDNYIHLIFSDNGIGLPKEHRGQLFKKYFTTKRAGADHGVGLHYSRIRARDLNGDLEMFNNRELPEQYGGPIDEPGAAAVFTLLKAK